MTRTSLFPSVLFSPKCSLSTEEGCADDDGSIMDGVVEYLAEGRPRKNARKYQQQQGELLPLKKDPFFVDLAEVSKSAVFRQQEEGGGRQELPQQQQQHTHTERDTEEEPSIDPTPSPSIASGFGGVCLSKTGITLDLPVHFGGFDNTTWRVSPNVKKGGGVCVGLRFLDLTGSSLTDEGATVLFRHLKRNAALQGLDLSHNKLGKAEKCVLELVGVCIHFFYQMFHCNSGRNTFSFIIIAVHYYVLIVYHTINR
jgi:hypothetical protein